MNKVLLSLFLILGASALPSSGLYCQLHVNNKPTIEIPHSSDKYSMRLDFMTESQIDDIVKSRTNELERLCAFTMGCQSRKDVVLNKGDKIQLFKDSRIKSVELIKLESGKSRSIAVYKITPKESYIIVPQQITRENIDLYSLLFIK